MLHEYVDLNEYSRETHSVFHSHTFGAGDHFYPCLTAQLAQRSESKLATSTSEGFDDPGSTVRSPLPGKVDSALT
jgi:hypothetical protein